MAESDKPDGSIDRIKASYCLVLRLSIPREVAVGRLGRARFPAGYYLYTGSAKAGLGHRLRRHLNRNKTLKWHIDYLRQCAEIEEIWWCESGQASECALRGVASKLSQAQLLVKGFGSSDCRCPAHLIYLPTRPSMGEYRSLLPNVQLFSQKF